MNTTQATSLLKKLARESGFSFVGINKATKLASEEKKLELWLKNNMHGSMEYMENHFEMRLDPRLLVPGAKSIVCLMYNYFTNEKQEKGTPLISKYAHGSDYHEVIKTKLKKLLFDFQKQVGDVQGRCFTDSAPILERAWAQKSGLGWVGKNGNLINRKSGSFFFLAEMVLDIELDEDAPLEKDFCGTCTACIDACPTEAILPGKIIDGSKCISYFTIESKKETTEIQTDWKQWVFGCDICQDVCPWNRFSKPHEEPLFQIHSKIKSYTQKDWLDISEEVFKKEFKNSPLKRAGLKKLQSSILKVK